MAEDSPVKSLEELAERTGINIRTLNILCGGTDDPLSLAQRKISHLIIFAELLGDASCVTTEIGISQKEVGAWTEIIKDMAHEALGHLADLKKALNEPKESPAAG